MQITMVDKVILLCIVSVGRKVFSNHVIYKRRICQVYIMRGQTTRIQVRINARFVRAGISCI